MKDEKTIDPALAALVEPEKEQATEIAPGMTVEEIRAVYFNADALKEPAYRLFQLNSDGHRYYYRFNDAGEPEFYPSVTTLLKQVMPTPPLPTARMVPRKSGIWPPRMEHLCTANLKN